MKSSILSRLTLGACALAATASSLYAQNTYPRLVLIEQFTSATCGPCVAAREPMHNTVNLANGVVSVRYHMNFPAPGDPWNVANPTEHEGRQSYYGVNSIPTARIDGVITDPRSESGMAPTVAADKAAKSPAYIKVWQEGGKIKVQVNSNIALTAHTLHVAMVNRFTAIPTLPSTLPNSNGEKDWEDALVDLLTGPTGEDITGIGANGSKVFEYDMTLGAGNIWPKNQQYVIAFIQEKPASGTGKVIQAGVTRDAADTTKIGLIKPSSITASISGDRYGKLDKGASVTRTVTFKNEGSSPATVMVKVANSDFLTSTTNGGPGWTITTGNVIVVAAGETKTADLTIKAPSAHAQYNDFEVSYTSTDGPGTMLTPFGLLTNGTKYAIYGGMNSLAGDQWTLAALTNLDAYKTDATIIPFNTAANTAYPFTDFDAAIYAIGYTSANALEAGVLQHIQGVIGAGKKAWVSAEWCAAQHVESNPNRDENVLDFFKSTMGMRPLGALFLINNGSLIPIDLPPAVNAQGEVRHVTAGTLADTIHANRLTQQHGLYYQPYFDVFTEIQGSAATPVHVLKNLGDGQGGSVDAVFSFAYQRSGGGRLFWTSLGSQSIPVAAEHLAYTERVMNWLMNIAPVAPVITLERSTVNFGTVAPGSKRTEVIKLTNTGTGDLKITDISISGADVDAFNITAGGATAGTITVPAKATHQITVEFAPNAGGTFSARLGFASNAKGTPVSVALQGSGTTGVSEDLSETGAIGLKVVGANPVVNSSVIELRSTSNVVLKAINSNGVVAQTLYSGSVNGTERINIDAATLASGAYTLVADNGSETAAVSIVIAR